MFFTKKIVWLVIGALVPLLIADLWGMALLYRHNTLIRVISVADLDTIHPESSMRGRDVLQNRFNGADPVAIMQKVMNAVQRTDTYDSHDVIDMLDHVDRGGGLGCSGMAALYSGALSANGFENRRIVLLRNMYGVYDAHSVVEVFVNRRWILYDPTFNISYVKNGRMIGAHEISQAFYDGTGDEIEIVHYGEVAYPARLDTYYMNWRPLYNNVFVLEYSDVGILEKIPPFRYWFGPRYFIQPLKANEQIQPHWYQLQQNIYLFFVVILPVIVITLMVTWVFIFFASFMQHKRQNFSTVSSQARASPSPADDRDGGDSRV
jgi:hypothetical protein